jgi:hypothetical protein
MNASATAPMTKRMRVRSVGMIVSSLFAVVPEIGRSRGPRRFAESAATGCPQAPALDVIEGRHDVQSDWMRHARLLC